MSPFARPPNFNPTSTGILEALDIRHIYIRPRTPHLNGKVECSHRVGDQEFYQLLDRNGITDDIHLFNEKLKEWEDYYNYHRPHGALAGQTPYERLLAKARAGASQLPVPPEWTGWDWRRRPDLNRGWRFCRAIPGSFCLISLSLRDSRRNRFQSIT